MTTTFFPQLTKFWFWEISTVEDHEDGQSSDYSDATTVHLPPYKEIGQDLPSLLQEAAFGDSKIQHDF